MGTIFFIRLFYLKNKIQTLAGCIKSLNDLFAYKIVKLSFNISSFVNLRFLGLVVLLLLPILV